MSESIGDLATRERTRILQEHSRRATAIDAEMYSPWNPAEEIMRAGRRRVALNLLMKAGVAPTGSDRCLEVGCGSQGWLADLLSWGIRPENICGIELDADRALRAAAMLPHSDVRVGDATELPWEDRSFRLVIASTVLSSVLVDDVQRAITTEMARVTADSGAVLVYDFRVKKPTNSAVRSVTRRRLADLFPGWHVFSRTVTLAPPLVRVIARRHPTTAVVVEALVPPLRTHRVTVLTRCPDSESAAPSSARGR